MSDQWFYWKDDDKRGPVSGKVLRELAGIGVLEPEDFVIREGWNARTLASEIRALFAHPAWHFTLNGITQGPVSGQTLKHLAQCLELSRDDLVWKQEMSHGIPAARIKGLFDQQSGDTESEQIYRDLYLCECGDLRPQDFCWSCGTEIPSTNQLIPGSAIGLIGLPDSGKTCYLAALHDQLMHAAPKWRVRVSDRAFDKLTDDYFWMGSGRIPSKTDTVISSNTGFFSITVVYGDQTLPLVMNDIAGEFVYQMVKQKEVFDSSNWDRELAYLSYLRQCRAILVAIPCWEMRAALEGVHHPVLNWNMHSLERERGLSADTDLARLFRKLTDENHHVQHVEALLVGVDIYQGNPAASCKSATDSFNRAFRVFPGVLKNSGITVGSTAVSNIGLDNDIGKDDYDGRTILSLPRPYNVLTPLQKIVDPTSFESTITFASSDKESPASTTRGRVFLSYRRDKGADTARLMRTSLDANGWATFLDVDDLGSSYFDDRLLLEIKRADGFILILSPGALDRCHEPDDWLRREISHAMQWEKRIVPVFKDGFAFSSDLKLPPDISGLTRINGVEYSHQFFDATVNKIVRHLTDV